jgi:hypothetical protein
MAPADNPTFMGPMDQPDPTASSSMEPPPNLKPAAQPAPPPKKPSAIPEIPVTATSTKKPPPDESRLPAMPELSLVSAVAPAAHEEEHSLQMTLLEQKDTVIESWQLVSAGEETERQQLDPQEEEEEEEAPAGQELIPYNQMMNVTPSDWVTAQLHSLTAYMAEHDVEDPCVILKEHFDNKIDELVAVKPQNNEDEEFIKKYIVEMNHFMVKAMEGLASAGGTPQKPTTRAARSGKKAETKDQETRLATIQQKRNPSSKSSIQNAIETRQRSKRSSAANKRRGIGN